MKTQVVQQIIIDTTESQYYRAYQLIITTSVPEADLGLLQHPRWSAL